MPSVDCKIIGIDEVGRGCLAGPLLVVAARATDELPTGLKDSKKLTKSQRENFYSLLTTTTEFGEGWVSAIEINRLGLTGATKLGVRRALNQLGATKDSQIIIDGNVNYCPKKFSNVQKIVGADNLVPIVSAASIIAKVKRDLYMTNKAKKYKGYYFEDNVGYGTAKHLEALRLLGPIAHFHRLNYAPFKALEIL